MNLLRRKAESAGGRVLEFPTRTTRLSRVCHGCGTFVKKPLSLRWHRCSCGVGPVQRDLYSAYLARHVENDRLSTESAREGWRAAESLLREAVERIKQTASGGDPSLQLRLLAGDRAIPPGSPVVEREGSGCRSRKARARKTFSNHGQNPPNSFVGRFRVRHTGLWDRALNDLRTIRTLTAYNPFK